MVLSFTLSCFRENEATRALVNMKTLKLAVEASEPVLVDVLCQPLEEARAPVSEWIA